MERLSSPAHFLRSRRDTGSKGIRLYNLGSVTTKKLQEVIVAARFDVHPILLPLSTAQVQPLMKSLVVRVTPFPRTLSLMNLKSRGGDVSSTVLARVTPLSTRKFSRNILRHSAGDGCSGGTTTAEMRLTEAGRCLLGWDPSDRSFEQVEDD